MKPAYTYLAQFYDQLMDQDYEQWCAYLIALWEKHGLNPRTILELGCGTGSLTIPLGLQGYSVTGVDISAEMVEIAIDKARGLGSNISFIVQDMQCLDLGGQTFDAAVSTCDAVNYLTDFPTLIRTFEAVYRHLTPGGLFLFDLNSEFKLRKIYGDRSFAEYMDDFAYFWDNAYDAAEDVCQMELVFFIPIGDGLYRKVTEKHQQKLWRSPQIMEIAEQTGFDVLGCYDFMTDQELSSHSERWQFVLKRL